VERWRCTTVARADSEEAHRGRLVDRAARPVPNTAWMSFQIL
jgi:hypothetical protein